MSKEIAVAAPAAQPSKKVEMTSAQALQNFRAARESIAYMIKDTQKSVNANFGAEVPAYNAGKDVHAVELAAEVKNRTKWERLVKGLDRAIILAEQAVEMDAILAAKTSDKK